MGETDKQPGDAAHPDSRGRSAVTGDLDGLAAERWPGESARHFILESSQVLFVSVDGEGRIKEANAVFRHRFGLPLRYAGLALSEYLRPASGSLSGGYGNHPGLPTIFLGPDSELSVLLHVYETQDGFCLFGLVERLDRTAESALLGDLTTQMGGLVQEARRANREIDSANQRMGAILGGTNAGTWEWNVQTGESQFDRRCWEMLGYESNDLHLSSFEEWAALIHWEDRGPVRDKLRAHFLRRAQRYEAILRMRHRTGRWVWISASGIVTRWTEDGRPEWMFGTHLDITALKHSELEASRARTRLDVIAAATVVGVVTVDSGGCVDYLSYPFTQLFGYAYTDLSDLQDWVARAGVDPISRHVLSVAFGKRRVSKAAETVLPNGREIRLRTRLGSIRSVLITAAQHDAILVVSFSDITERKHHEQMALHRSQHDSLTGLANRTLFNSRLEWCMRQARRGNWLLCVCYLDLDGFKPVNDGYGHAAGDAVLKAMSARLKSALREVDVIARLGGDEFAFVITEVRQRKECLPLLERLLGTLKEPVLFDGHIIEVSCSIGVSFFAQDSTIDGDQLLHQADKAMYEAKLAGKNRVAVFDDDLAPHLQEMHASVRDVRRALQADEFELSYQPVVSMRTGEILRFEALIRWKTAQGRLRGPETFLPAISEHAVSRELGGWVLNRALRNLEHALEAGHGLPISVNVFPKQLLDPEFIDRLRELLEVHPQVDPSLVSLEIVETAALNDVDGAKRAILQCKALGIGCALDDFGTGFSSLSHLKHLPVSTLKIDKSFVAELLTDADSLAIVESTLSLAKVFKREVVAEGVETVEHGLRLLELGCEVAQGYVIGKPMPADELSDWLRRWVPPPEWASHRG